MGLIREIQGVNATINKQERARRERERQKILTENYTREIKEALFAEFYAIYKHYDTKTAEEIMIQQKDDIIQKLYDEIYNRHYLQNNGAVDLVFLPSPTWDKKWRYEQKKEKVFIYRDFDIITDLSENYFKILQKAKKEIYSIKQIENKKLFDELKKKIGGAMTLDENKYFLSIALQENENIETIINSIAKNENEKNYLINNYEKAFKQVIKLYQGNIVKNKMDLKAQKEQAKNENQKKVARWLLFNYIMAEILKTLPKPFNKKRKY